MPVMGGEETLAAMPSVNATVLAVLASGCANEELSRCLPDK